jgi:hypothetical protein
MNLKELETTGYTIIPNFLSNNSVLTFCQKYTEGFNSNLLRNKNYKVISETPTESLLESINNILKQVSLETSIKVSVISNTISFFDSKLVHFNWHQEHESYYVYQNLYNSLNFWIPLIKEDKNQCGLDVIPHNTLEKISPDLFNNHIVGKGAKLFKTGKHNITMIDEERGGETLLDIDFESIKHTPQVGPGDLLLMRGDIIHRSQRRPDTAPKRLGMSIKAFDGYATIHKDVFFGGCSTKQQMIQNNLSNYRYLLDCYNKHNTITIDQFLNKEL